MRSARRSDRQLALAVSAYLVTRHPLTRHRRQPTRTAPRAHVAPTSRREVGPRRHQTTAPTLLGLGKSGHGCRSRVQRGSRPLQINVQRVPVTLELKTAAPSVARTISSHPAPRSRRRLPRLPTAPRCRDPANPRGTCELHWAPGVTPREKSRRPSGLPKPSSSSTLQACPVKSSPLTCAAATTPR